MLSVHINDSLENKYINLMRNIKYYGLSNISLSNSGIVPIIFPTGRRVQIILPMDFHNKY